MKNISRTVESTIKAHEETGYYLEVKGVKCFVADQGEGEPVVCLHGVPTSSFLYRKVVRALADAGLRGISIDYPGLGLSSRPKDFDYSFSGLVEFCASVIEKLALDSFHLVVHDIGGPIGFALAGTVKPKVRSITILNTWVEVDTFEKPLPMRPFSWPVAGELELATIQHSTWAVIFRNLAVEKMDGITNEEVSAYVDLLKRFLKIMRGFDYSESFKLRCYLGVKDTSYPVQAIWGANDPGLRFERYGREIERVIKPDPFITVRGKHLLQEDQWDEISRRIISMAKSVAKPRELYRRKIRQDGSMSRIGADFLIDESGVVQRAYYGRFLGDHLPVGEVREFLKYGRARQGW